VEKVRDVIRDNKAQKEAFLRDQRDAIMVGVKNAHVILNRGRADISELTDDDLGDHIFVGGEVLYRASGDDEDAIKAALKEIDMDKYADIIKNHGTIASCKELTHSDLRACGVPLLHEREKIINALKDLKPARRSKSRSRSRGRSDSRSGSSSSASGDDESGKAEEWTRGTIVTATQGQDYVDIKSCGDEGDTTLAVARNELRIPRDSHAVIDRHIRTLAKSGQGLRNLAHVDPQPIVEDFAARWVPMYEEVLKQAVKSIDDFVRGAVKEALARGRDTDRTRRAVELLERRATAGLDDLRRDADRCVARLVRYCKPPLVFTTNEHYLTSAFQNVVGDLASKPPTDESNAMIIHARWLAFRKVQSKVIIEAAAKDLIGIYTVDFDARVSDLLDNTRLVDLVEPESQWQANQREQVVKDLATLDELIKAFDGSS
jgi:hypothetical protein